MSLFLCALAKWAQQFRCNEYQYQPHYYPFSLHRAPILACTILTLLEDIPGLLSAVHTCWEQVLAAYTTRTISFTCRSHDVAISVSVVVWKKKKYILIYGGHCFGVGGWERAMAFRFFFFFLHCSGAELLSGKNDCAACLHCKPNWWPVHLSARWKQWTAKEIYSVYMTVGWVLRLTSKPMR